ncbi:MAG: hypothetical protein LBJ44_03085 [Propionibacteriaceae bacterium]|nr:hypothetical protein [Propionibacteriaceae bacterium]
MSRSPRQIAYLTAFALAAMVVPWAAAPPAAVGDEPSLVAEEPRTDLPTPVDAAKAVSVRVSAEPTGQASAQNGSGPFVVMAADQVLITAPVILGQAEVGATLSVDPVSTDPESAVVLYAWLVDGLPVKQGTGSEARSWTPTLSDLGKEIVVRVTAVSEGHSTAVAESVVVTVGVVQPQISGDPRVGSELTVAAASDVPAGWTATYTWLRDDGVELRSGTDQAARAYTPAVADVGKQITVVVSLAGAGLTAAAESDPVQIGLGILAIDRPGWSATPRVDQQLAIWKYASRPAHAQVTYSLLLDDQEVWSTVTGSTAGLLYYTPTGQQLGQSAVLRLSAALDGYATVVTESDPLTVLPGQFGLTRPQIGGDPMVGGVLTAGLTGAPSDATLTYTWLADGAVIQSGAGADQHTVRPADSGKAIQVRVAAEMPNYTPATSTLSPPVLAGQPWVGQPVAAIRSSATATTGAPGTALQIQPEGHPSQFQAAPVVALPPGGTIVYTWLADGVPTTSPSIADGATSGTFEQMSWFQIGPEHAGRELTVRATATWDDLPQAVSESAPVAIDPAVIEAIAPVIFANYGVGETIRVGPSNFTPNGISPSPSRTFEWLVDGVVVKTGLETFYDGYDARAYTVRLEDLGKEITVRLTVASEGYQSIPATSAAIIGGDLTIAPAVISGVPKPGSLLLCNDPVASLYGGETTFTWLVDGVVMKSGTIRGSADSPRAYRPTVADVGKSVVVRLENRLAGHIVAVSETEPIVVLPGDSWVDRPVILGQPRVGAASTVDQVATSNADATVAYTWLVGGRPVKSGTDAAARTYTPAPGEAGERLTVRVLATETGYAPAENQSEPVTVLSDDQLTVDRPVISGAAQVGGTLTVAQVATSPIGGAVTYNWLADGVTVQSGTDPQARSYTPVAGDLFKQVTVRVTAALAGRTEAVSQSTPVVIEPADVFTVERPVIEGVVRAGAALEVSPVQTSPAGGAVVYNWLVDGVAVKSGDGPDARSYRPAGGDVGHLLSVRVQATAPGQVRATAESDPVTIGAGTLTIGQPWFEGYPNPGGSLSARTPESDPPGADLSYSWLLDGVVAQPWVQYMPNRYAPTEADTGKELVLRVVARMDGHTTSVAESDPVEIGLPLLRIFKVFSLQPFPFRVGATVTAGQVMLYDEAPAGVPVTYTYSWLIGGEERQTGDGVAAASYTPVPADVGQTISLRVTASAPGRTSVPYTLTTVTLIQPGWLGVGQPVISGDPRVGSSLTVEEATTTPAGVQVTYLWYADEQLRKSGSDATARSYTPDVDDLGRDITVRVAAESTGHAPAQATSDPVMVMAGSLTVDRLVISGDPRMGSELTVAAVATDPSGAVVTYSWLVDGVTVRSGTGAAARSYTPVPEDVGADVWVEAAATLAGHEAARSQSQPVKIVASNQLMIETPVIIGFPKAGVDVEVGAAVTTPDYAMPWVHYYWLVDGEVRASSDLISQIWAYRLDPADVGKPVQVRITAELGGFEDAEAYSAPVTILPSNQLEVAPPTFYRESVVGSELLVNPVMTSPEGASIHLTWLVGGQEVMSGPYETASSYHLRGSAYGEDIVVVASATKDGCLPGQSESEPIRVGLGAMTVGQPVIGGDIQIGGRLTVGQVATTPDDGAQVTYTWLVGGRPVHSGVGAAGLSYTAAAADFGQVVEVRALAQATGYFDAVSQSVPVTLAASDQLTVDQPVISGDPRVGGSLAIDPVATSPLGGEVLYEWLVGGASVRSGSWLTTRTYSPVVGDLGQVVTVRAVATLTGYNQTMIESDPVTVLGAEELMVGQPVISGVPKVGSGLAVDEVATDPSGGTVTYTWLANGVVVKSGTDSAARSYLPLAGDIGKQIVVEAAAQLDGYESALSTSDGVTVAAGDLAVGRPVISGDRRAGSTLTVEPVETDPDGGAVTYRWLADGLEVGSGPYADASRHSLTADDVGKEIVVEVSATLAGHNDAVNRSEPVLIAAGNMTVGRPVIVGSPRVGAALTVAPVVTDPWGGSVTYVWLVGDRPVKSGLDTAARSYRPTVGDLDQQITVQVTATLAGRIDAVNQSDPVTVAASDQLSVGQPVIAGDPMVGSVLTVVPVGTQPSGGTVTYTWLADGVPVSSGTDTAARSHTLVPSDVGQQIMVQASAVLAGYRDAVNVSDPVVVVASDQLSVGQPVISGEPMVGSVLTVVPVGTVPVGGMVTYTWLVDGSVIGSGDWLTARNHTPTAGEVGRVITVQVTARLAGYEDAVNVSDPVTVVASDQLSVSQPVIGGTPMVGSVLTVAPVVTSPAGGTVTYTWSVGGVPVSSGTDPAARTYIPAVGDLGQQIVVQVSARLAGYEDAVNRSDPVTVVVSDQLSVGRPVIAGSPRPGSALMVDEVVTVPVGGVVTYTWSMGGVPVNSGADAAARSYTPTAGDLGRQMVVQVSAVLAGYQDAVNVSDPVTVIASDQLSVGQPVIAGEPRVGSVLTVDEVVTDPVGGTVTYSWRADGVELKSGVNAAARSYILVPSDVGQQITVQVAATLAGYRDAVNVSDPVRVVASDQLSVGQPVISGGPMVGSTLTVAPVVTSPAGGTVTYSWRADGVELKSGVDAAARSHILVPSDVGQQITVQVTATLAGYQDAVNGSDPVTVIASDQLSVGKPIIVGSPRPGSLLTVGEVVTVPSGGVVVYTWSVGGVLVSSGAGAGARSYTPTAGGLGQEIVVQVSAALAGHIDAVNVSDPVRVVASDQLSVAKPVIVGEPSVGSVLTVDEVTTDPPGGAVVYTWSVGGVPVNSGADAAARSYTPSVGDVGEQVTVQVTATLAGYQDAVSLSAPVTVVAVPPPSSAKAVTAVAAPAGARVNGLRIEANVASGLTRQLIDVTVSAAATWQLCDDQACVGPIADRTMTLAVGENTAYLEISAEDGSRQIYTVVVTRANRALVVAAVKSPPAQTAYTVGQALDLTGLVVTLSYDDGADEEVEQAGLAARGLATSLAHGAALAAEHDGHVLTLTGAGLATSPVLATLAVAAAVICPAGQQWDPGLGQCVADSTEPTTPAAPDPTGPGRSGLPYTGSVDGQLAGLALLLVAAGAAVVLSRRRRRFSGGRNLKPTS